MKTARNLSPCIITTLIFVFVIFLGWSAYRASTRGSAIADPDYYSKGLKYNATLVEKKAATVLGWTFQTRLSGANLTISLHDKLQQPVTNGEATLQLYSPDTPVPTAVPLHESQPGLYSLTLPADLNGEIRARFDFHKDGARLSRTLLLNL